MPKLTVNEIKAEEKGQLINNKSLDEHGKKISSDVLKNNETARD